MTISRQTLGFVRYLSIREPSRIHLVELNQITHAIQQSTMSFDRLSDELVLEIAKHVERLNYRGNRLLGPLVLCSRRLNGIISPLLYRTFIEGWDKPLALPSLLRLVMEKPNVGAEVKKLVMTEADEINGVFLDMSGYSPQQFEQCRTTINSFGIPPFDKLLWMTAIERGEWGAVLSLLLLFLPSLEEIEIESGNLADTKFLHQIVEVMAQQAETAQSLRKLRSFSIAHWDTEGGMSTDVILPFCAVPSVRTIRAHMLEEDDHFGLLPPPLPSSKQYQVRNLRISNSCIGGNTMANLLRCFPVLEKIYYDHGGAIVGIADFLPQKFGTGIVHLHDCLEELTLLRIESRPEVLGDEDAGRVGSLADFKKLRCVGTEAEVLFGQDVVKPRLATILPASLEHLLIRRCGDDVYDNLRNLISHKKEKFPALKSIAIDIPEARKNPCNNYGPDGRHERQENLEISIENLAKYSDTPNAAAMLKNFRKELLRIESNKPTESDWEAWRERQSTEQDLIHEFKKAGIDLQFNLLRGNAWMTLPDFMMY